MDLIYVWNILFVQDVAQLHETSFRRDIRHWINVEVALALFYNFLDADFVMIFANYILNERKPNGDATIKKFKAITHHQDPFDQKSRFKDDKNTLADQIQLLKYFLFPNALTFQISDRNG